MGPEFLSRVRKTAIISGLFLSWIVAAYWDVAAGAGWAIGCVWSLVNLYFIGRIVRLTLSGGPKIRRRAAFLLMIKIPVLYGIGFVLLWSGWIPVIALLAGFTWPLIVSTLKILARAIMRMDDPHHA